MYVVRTVSGNNNNMTMSMTTTRYGIVITTIAFITMRGALWATEYDEKTQNNIKVQYADADTSIEEGYVIKRHPACLHAYIVTRLGN